MLHEQFSRWLQTLHKIILAHHDDNCECDCAFCLSCGDIDNLSNGTFMRLMLCPPSLRFHGSTIPLFDWQCIENEYVFLVHAGSYNNLPQLTFRFRFLNRCNLCHSNKLESLFECPVTRLLYDEGEVDYWMYEPVDLTEQSATNSATGTTMQGELHWHMNLHYCVPLNPFSANFFGVRGSRKSQTRPSLGEEEILKVSFLPTSFLRHASLLLASPDRSCSAWWEKTIV